MNTGAGLQAWKVKWLFMQNVSNHSTLSVTSLWPMIFVQDIEKSIAFYKHRLGFDLAENAESNGNIFWCRVEREGCSIMLQQAEPEDGPHEGRGRGVVLYLNCVDADVIHAELTKRGLALNAPRTMYYGMRQVNVPDPDGYELCFSSLTKER